MATQQRAEVLNTVEGPNGTAEVLELESDSSPNYGVRYQGQIQVFPTLGEAYIEAGNLAGVSV